MFIICLINAIHTTVLRNLMNRSSTHHINADLTGGDLPWFPLPGALLLLPQTATITAVNMVTTTMVKALVPDSIAHLMIPLLNQPTKQITGKLSITQPTRSLAHLRSQQQQTHLIQRQSLFKINDELAPRSRRLLPLCFLVIFDDELYRKMLV